MLASALLALALLLAVPAPDAPPALEEEVLQAKRHFEQGQASYRDGRWAEAVREFEAANSIKPHPIFLYDMAQAYRMAGDPAHALEMYRAYLAVDPEAKNRRSVEQKMAELKTRILSATARQMPWPEAKVPEVAPRSEARPVPSLVAVLEVRSLLEGDARRSVDVKHLGELLRSAALRAGPGIEAIPGAAAAGCESDCEVATGRKLGADLVVSGELIRSGGNYKLDLRLHDTRSGKLVATAAASAATVDELDAQAQEAARELMHAKR